MIRTARYEIVSHTPSQLVLKDLGPWTQYMTITNAAEIVVDELLQSRQLKPGMQLFYFDSDGQLDEIVFNVQGFTGFRPGPRGKVTK